MPATINKEELGKALIKAAQLFYEVHKTFSFPWEDFEYNIRFQEKSGLWFKARINVNVSPIITKKSPDDWIDKPGGGQ